MHLKSSSLLLFILFSTLAFFLPDGRARAQNQQPTNVGLVYFIAETHPNGVKLTWETATELNAAGFTIHRRTGPIGDFIYLEEIGFIDSQGGPATGYIYQVVDETAVLGQTYTYRLREIEFNSQVIDLADATITVGATPTPTPSITPTATVTASSNPLNPPNPATATPTVTASATAAANIATATPPPGATPLPPTPSRLNAATITPTSASQIAPTTAPDNAAQPTAVPPTANIAQPTAVPSSPTPTSPTQSAAPDRNAIALAQEPDAPTAVVPESYPDPSGENDPNAEQPANTQPQPIGDGQPTPLPVIGSGEAYDAPPPPAPSGSSQAANSRSTLFLWAGFIVALLIFITGVVGSIILYTRRTR